MAGKNVSQLTPVASLTGTELMYVSQGGVDKSATPDDIVALAPVSSGTIGLVQLSDGAGGFTSDAGLSFAVVDFVQTLTTSAYVSDFIRGQGYDLQLHANVASPNSLSLAEDTSVVLQGGSSPYGAVSVDVNGTLHITSGVTSLKLDPIVGSVVPEGTPNTIDFGAVGAELKSGYFGTSVVTPDVVMSSGATSIIILPTVDPEVVGALWNNLGTITISAGP